MQITVIRLRYNAIMRMPNMLASKRTKFQYACNACCANASSMKNAKKNRHGRNAVESINFTLFCCILFRVRMLKFMHKVQLTNISYFRKLS